MRNYTDIEKQTMQMIWDVRKELDITDLMLIKNETPIETLHKHFETKYNNISFRELETSVKGSIYVGHN